MGVRRDHHRFSRQVTRTARWQVLRMATLERDGYRCRSCGCGGRLEVDHVQPVRTHPALSCEPGNLQALCPSCHTSKTRIECGHPPPIQDRQDWRHAVSMLEHGDKTNLEQEKKHARFSENRPATVGNPSIPGRNRRQGNPVRR